MYTESHQVFEILAGCYALQHPRCVVIADGEAASQLEGKEYYNWIFENEPEWEPYR